MRQSLRPRQKQRTSLKQLHELLEDLLKRQRVIAYIDPLDVRYNYFEQRPEPREHAVMFCLMDVSASMGEREKDLAKRFFVLLHLFLSRRYDSIDLVFVRHTHNAQEVDEETFFYAKETGGHRGQHGTHRGQTADRGALSAFRMEHLHRPGIRRRELLRRLQEMRHAAE